MLLRARALCPARTTRLTCYVDRITSPVSLEQFANIYEAIAGGAARDAVIAPHGLTAAGWLDTQRYWLDQLARELRRGEQKLASRYLAICRPTESVDDTAFVPALIVPDMSDPLPFAPAPQASPPPERAASKVAAEGEDMIGETQFMDALTDEDLGQTIPFD